MELSRARLPGWPLRSPAPWGGEPRGHASLRAALPRPDRVHFGQKPYEALYQEVALTPEQAPTARLIEEISRASRLDSPDRFLAVLQSPHYVVLTRIKGRDSFHTPFTDLFMRLDNHRAREKLIKALETTAWQPPSMTARSNALLVLCDLYFGTLRPGGRLAKAAPGRRQRQLQAQLLAVFSRFMNPANGQPELSWQLQRQLRIHWLQFVTGQTWKPDSAFQDADGLATRRQIVPLLTRILPAMAARPPANPALLRKLEAALLDETPQPLREMSRSRELVRLIPEWGRLVGFDNVQHSDQHFNLAEHSLNAVMHARRSPYFQQLSPREQRLAMFATLLHDIGKETGPGNLHCLIAVDRPHPAKSEMIAAQVLPALGFSPEETATVCRLILYHQVLGTLCTRNPKPPDEGQLEQLAALIPTPAELVMLQALTEGDIRSVKRDSAWFTPEIAGRLRDYGGMIDARIRRNRAQDFVVPHQDPLAVLAALWQKRTDLNSRLDESLDALLQGMAFSYRRVGLAMREGVFVFRPPSGDKTPWLAMDARDANLDALTSRGNRLQDGMFDHTLHQLHLWKPADFAHSRLPYGFLVEVDPQDVAYAGDRAILGAGATDARPALLDTDHAYRQIVSGQTQQDAFTRLWAARLQPDKPNPAEVPNPVVLAVRPHIRALYYRQKKTGDPIRLPRELLRLAAANGWPIALFQP